MLAGFAARKGLSEGIHDSLKTHCIVIKNDSTAICIITNDLMEVSTSTYADIIRAQIAQKSGLPIEHIFMNTTHTHSAPRVGGYWADEGGPNYEYRDSSMRIIIDNAVSAINAEESKFQPFTIAVAKSKCDIGGNRCEKNGPKDEEVYAVKFLEKRGKPIFSILNYSCHPVSLSHKSQWVSTDYPGAACRTLQKEWKCPVFYFTGASGNIDPASGLKARPDYTDSLGTALALSIKDATFTKLAISNRLDIVNRELHLPYAIDTITKEAVRIHAEQLVRCKGVSGSWVDDVYRWRDGIYEDLDQGKVVNYLPFNVGAANIGGLIFFFTQGEPFCEYQINLRKAFPDNNIIFVAYTNGQNSYLPSAHAFEVEKGYEYETKQMHVYVHAPYVLSSSMPDVYESQIKDLVNTIK